MNAAAILPAACLLVTAAYGLFVMQLLRNWNGLPVYGPPAGGVASVPVSVIVPARNEENAIGLCLESLLRQQGVPDWEIVVVDDFSSDGTAEAVRMRMAAAPAGRIRLVQLSESLPETSGSKKAAIHAGIAAARGTVILTTDADCVMGPRWMAILAAAAAEPGTGLVAGPVWMRAGRFVERLQQLDFATLVGSGGATLGTRYPLMCNGANLGFPRAVYEAARTAEPIAGEPLSGDDTFLMLAVRRHRLGRLTFLKAREAVVTTDPCRTLAGFLRQRIRWGTKVKAYRPAYVAATGLFVLAVHLLILAGVALAFSGNASQAAWLVPLGMKGFADAMFVGTLSRFFGEPALRRWFVPVFLLQLLYLPLLAVASAMVTVKWKGRTT